jgi:hypothetical protein
MNSRQMTSIVRQMHSIHRQPNCIARQTASSDHQRLHQSIPQLSSAVILESDRHLEEDCRHPIRNSERISRS